MKSAWHEPNAIAYGGAFDPPHEGHRLLLHRTSECFPQADLYVVPTKTPPRKKPLASFEQRMDMCRLAFATELTSLPLHIDPIEGFLPDPSYTVRTLETLRRRQADAHWGLLIGRDQMSRFSDWYQPKEIASMVSLIVVDRDVTAEVTPLVMQQAERLGMQLEALSADTWQWKDGKTGIRWLSGCVSPAASSVIRDNWRLAPEGWLAPQVLEYMKRFDLY